MRRLTALIALLALGLGISLSAHTVNVGTVTDVTDCFPINTYFGYSYSQQIYTQPQINHQGEISRIRFYRGYIGSLDYSDEWTIYMGHTSRSAFSSHTDWEPISNLTQVFSGSVLANFPPPGNWMEITLDTPFNYDNVSNLVLAIHENTPYWDNTLSAEWGVFNSGSFSGLHYQELFEDIDINNPPASLGVRTHINALQLVFPDTEVPMAPLMIFPADNASIVNGQELSWNLPAGSADISGYDVYIDGSIVSSNQPANHYLVSGLAPGPHTWQVVARNQVGSSAPSETRNFNLAEGVVIGNGTRENKVPIYPVFRYSYTQSIFLQSEINLSNRSIERIAYYWNGAGAATNSRDWAIYMGHTQRTEFTNGSDWVPVSELVPVFTGQVDIPATPGWIEIELDTPFAYNNTDNLIVAVDENSPGGEESYLYFYGTDSPDQNRSIITYSNGFNIDPVTNNTGNAIPAFPNIMLQFGSLPTHPVLSVSPLNIDFGAVLNGQTTAPLSVLAANLGGGTLNLTQSDIGIIGPNAAEFTLDPLNLPAALAAGESISLPISVTGVSSGDISATLRIVYNGQNHDVELSAHVLPTGTIEIGNGPHTQRYPFGLYYGHERSATLYTADQIGTTGFIDMISWYCATPSNTSIPYKIWAKNTTESSMTPQTWQSFVSDMTLLKEGNYTPNTTGWNIFQLTTPFAYTGNGLIIAVETNLGGFGGGGSNTYRYTTVYSHQHQFWYENGEPPTEEGYVNGKMPNILLHLSSELQDLGALSITGYPSPTVNELTHYTLTLRNNGASTQNDYQVKLIDAAGTGLVSITGPAIDPQETLQVALPWTPTTEGPVTIYGKVELSGDDYSLNDKTPPLNINVLPAGLSNITIGSGNEDLPVPLDYSFRCGLHESLYFADEIGLPCNIYKLVLYNDFSTDLPDMPVKIWMGLTDRQDLLESWIPASQMTLVFDGSITFPSGQNEIIIPLHTPFAYMGGNLVMMFKRPMGDAYQNCHFQAQSANFTRARKVGSDFMDLDPNSTQHAGVTLSTQYPKTTFIVMPYEGGSIIGTVTGADSQPLGGVSVNLNDGSHYTTTDFEGQYQLHNILPGTHTISFNKHGYDQYTQTFELAEGAELIINACLHPLVRISVSGTVLDGSTETALAGALIQLSGTGFHQTYTDAAGGFIIADVFANRTYEYTISAAGYLTEEGQLDLGDTDHDMGEISLSEIPCAPVSVAAVINDSGDAVELTWLPPDPSLQQIATSFEDENFPPPGWTQVINNFALPYPEILPTWSRVGTFNIGNSTIIPSDGGFQAGIHWQNQPLDEWLITPLFNCQPNTFLSFDSYVSWASVNQSVKVSLDGGASWIVLWNATEQSNNCNSYFPVTIDLDAYGGNQIKVAFHLSSVDGSQDSYSWFIDNISIGAGNDPIPLLADDLRPGEYTTPRAPIGYLVYRMRYNQEQNEAAWACLTPEPTTAFNFTDTGWNTLPDGSYRWAVRAAYSSGHTSIPVFSNLLDKGISTGVIMGTVTNEDGFPIPGANVTNLTYSTTTNSAGAYVLYVQTGENALQVSAVGYQTQTRTNIIIHRNQVEVVNVVLIRQTAADDPQSPVAATALNGIYPNPFNPQTTISYSVKEAGRVKLEVYNIKGQKVRTLVDEDHATGRYTRVFDARDNRGRSISSGVYLLLMSAPEYLKTSKIMLMK